MTPEAAALLEARVATLLATRPGTAGSAILLESLRHGRQVAFLVRALFDGCLPLHDLDPEWRTRLVVSAFLHDLGQLAGEKGHHRSSEQIVLGVPGLVPVEALAAVDFLLEVLPADERPLLAMLCRYHRKAWPDIRNRAFADLGLADRQAVSRAAALLRLADGLDREHAALVAGLEVRLAQREVVLCLHPRKGASWQAFTENANGGMRKGDLFVDLFARSLTWQQH